MDEPRNRTIWYKGKARPVTQKEKDTFESNGIAPDRFNECPVKDRAISTPIPTLTKAVEAPVIPREDNVSPDPTEERTGYSYVKAWRGRNKDKHNANHRAYMQRWRAKRKVLEVQG